MPLPFLLLHPRRGKRRRRHFSLSRVLNEGWKTTEAAVEAKKGNRSVLAFHSHDFRFLPTHARAFPFFSFVLPAAQSFFPSNFSSSFRSFFGKSDFFFPLSLLYQKLQMEMEVCAVRTGWVRGRSGKRRRRSSPGLNLHGIFFFSSFSFSPQEASEEDMEGEKNF